MKTSGPLSMNGDVCWHEDGTPKAVFFRGEWWPVVVPISMHPQISKPVDAVARQDNSGLGKISE